MSISFSGSDQFLIDKMKSLFNQTPVSITEQDMNRRTLNLNLKLKNNKLHISDNQQIERDIIIPTHINEIMTIVNFFQDKYSVTIGLINFFPFKGTIEFENKVKRLGSIQNNILEILVNKKKGISKNNLYQEIWPNDKNIQENKLDTHLTNLKNSFFTLANKNLKIKTIKKIINIDIS